ncbi:MAG: methyltransferase domain-containing protein [Anaerolineae bacterium]|nr:methyltransferase domain-containing protein [Anaerolineae bacterium]
MLSILKCPVCELPLSQVGSSYRCANEHSFDVAKEGYINLLLSNQKKSKAPGDNAEMMLHRRQFLEHGYYQPLAEYLTSEIDFICSDESPVLLDVGCGEGYYTGYVQQNLACRPNCYGVDISKKAVQYAAKRYRDVVFMVGSVAQLPVLDESVDCLINIFAPANITEFARILKGDGYLLVVTPAANHLRQLREMIYDTIRPYESGTSADFSQRFRRIKQHNLAYRIQLESAPDIEHLFKMTPFFWSTPAEKQALILGRSHFEMDVSFSIEVFQKL